METLITQQSVPVATQRDQDVFDRDYRASSIGVGFLWVFGFVYPPFM